MVREYRGRHGGETEAQKEMENRQEQKKIREGRKTIVHRGGGQKEMSRHEHIKDEIK